MVTAADPDKHGKQREARLIVSMGLFHCSVVVMALSLAFSMPFLFVSTLLLVLSPLSMLSARLRSCGAPARMALMVGDTGCPSISSRWNRCRSELDALRVLGMHDMCTPSITLWAILEARVTSFLKALLPFLPSAVLEWVVEAVLVLVVMES